MDTAYAVPAPQVATAAFHCPTELRFLSADDTLDVAYFVADSKTAPGKVNVIGLDVLTGESHCSCKAAECGRDCWHAALVQAAWDGHSARLAVARLNNDQLEAAGEKANRMARIYRNRIGRTLPDDATTLIACRAEYRARRVAAPADELLAA
jgi:hypothetical protein